jgi:hypothetical protein
MKNYWLDKKEERKREEEAAAEEANEVWIYSGPEHSDFTYTEHTFAPIYDFLIEDDDGETKQEKTS